MADVLRVEFATREGTALASGCYEALVSYSADGRMVLEVIVPDAGAAPTGGGIVNERIREQEEAEALLQERAKRARVAMERVAAVLGVQGTVHTGVMQGHAMVTLSEDDLERIAASVEVCRAAFDELEMRDLFLDDEMRRVRGRMFSVFHGDGS